MKMKTLRKDIGARIAVRLHAALTEVGACIDDLRLNAPSLKRPVHTESTLAIDRVQSALVELTINANRSARKGN